MLALLADGMLRTKSEAAHEAGVSPGVVDGLVDDGALETLVLPPEPVARQPDPDFAIPEFTDAQRAASDALARRASAKSGFSVTLVDGVTGSGKTEVYFEAVAEAIRRSKQVLILMPEIALTAQFLDRFAARFGVRPAEWHSEIAPRKRARTWSAVAAGEAPVVVGARSALFLPYADLGLIVVDEEHDPGLQAGGRRPLPRPRHGGGAGARDQDSDRARLGDAVGRDRGERARAAATCICNCPSGSAASICRRSRPSIFAAKARRAAASSRRGWPRR